MLPDKSSLNEIPNATYFTDGVNTSLVVPALSTYTLSIKQVGEYPVEIKVQQLYAAPNGTEGQLDVVGKVVFTGVPMTSGSQGSMQVSLDNGIANFKLLVDDNNDTITDRTITPDSTLDAVKSMDYTAPVTSSTVTGQPDEFGFYQGTVTVTLEAVEEEGGSGILRTEYSLDGGRTWLTYSTTLSIDSDRVPEIKARSVDQAGNWEYPWKTVRLSNYNIRLPIIRR